MEAQGPQIMEEDDLVAAYAAEAKAAMSAEAANESQNQLTLRKKRG